MTTVAEERATVDDGAPREAATAAGDDAPGPVPATAFERLVGIRNGRRTLLEAAGVAVVATALASWLYRVWAVALTVPFTYGGDALLHAAYVQRMQEAPWYIHNDRLGAPYGLDASDFPLGGENAHWLALKVLGAVLPTPGAAMNGYLIITYALIAFTSYVVGRALGLRRWTTVVVALLFAFLPFHQSRGVVHLLRSGYYIVPVVVLAMYWLARWGRELRAPSGPSWWGLRRDRVVALAVVAVVLGGSDTQNAVYGSILLVAIGAGVSVAGRDRRPLTLALVFTALVGASLCINNAPYVVARVTDPNEEVAHRSLHEQELYSLRPAQLLLPVTGHRLEPLADLKGYVKDEVTVQEDSQSLGAFGSIGFVVSLVAAAAVLAAPLATGRVRFMGLWGGLNLVVVAVATSQGLSFLLSIAGLTMLRTWNRTSLYIAFFSLVVLAIALEALADRITSPRTPRAVPAALCAAAIVALGVLDQSPATGVVQSERARTAYDRDSAFYGAVEQALGPGAMVYQLPVTRFPEQAPMEDLGMLEQLTAYLHSEELRWSAGAMTGRPEAEWQHALAAYPPRALVVGIAAVGFDGAVVHRRGYGAEVGEVETAMADLAGPPAIVDAERGLAFYDLRPLRQRLETEVGPATVDAAASQLVQPVELRWDDDFYATESDRSGSWRWTSSSTATLSLFNRSDSTRTVAISAAFRHFHPDATDLTISGPFGEDVVDLDRAGRWWRELEVPPGETRLELSADAPPQLGPRSDPRQFGLQVRGLVIREADVRLLLCAEGLADAASRCARLPGAGR